MSMPIVPENESERLNILYSFGLIAVGKLPELDVFAELACRITNCPSSIIAIMEKDQQRIFERFYMANRARAKKTGTGLGLSIVKHVVRLHNGEIDLKSNVGAGTSVKIAFRRLNSK